MTLDELRRLLDPERRRQGFERWKAELAEAQAQRAKPPNPWVTMRQEPAAATVSKRELYGTWVPEEALKPDRSAWLNAGPLGPQWGKRHPTRAQQGVRLMTRAEAIAHLVIAMYETSAAFRTI